MAKPVRPHTEVEDEVMKAVEDVDAASSQDTPSVFAEDAGPSVAEEIVTPAADEDVLAQTEPQEIEQIIEPEASADFSEVVEPEEVLQTLSDEARETATSSEEPNVPDAEIVEDIPLAAAPPPPPTPPSPQPVAQKSRGGFLGTALGGVVAAAAGYALATFAPIPGIFPAPTPTAEEQAAMQALTARLDTLEAAPAPDATLADRIAALEARPVPPEPDLSPVTAQLSALEARLASLEADGTLITGDGPPAGLIATVETLRKEVDALKLQTGDATAGIEAMVSDAQSRMEEAEKQAAALKAEAEETARKALAGAAVGRLEAALDTGAPYSDALADLQGYDVPAILADAAESGLPSAAAITAAFPEVARLALDSSLRADMGESWSDRAASFLQSTTGARSLTPREGDDADAVLSRAEAAVRAGDLPTALTELKNLPEAGQAAMAEWSGMAQHRLDAAAAIAALAAEVKG